MFCRDIYVRRVPAESPAPSAIVENWRRRHHGSIKLDAAVAAFKHSSCGGRPADRQPIRRRLDVVGDQHKNFFKGFDDHRWLVDNLLGCLHGACDCRHWAKCLAEYHGPSCEVGAGRLPWLQSQQCEELGLWILSDAFAGRQGGKHESLSISKRPILTANSAMSTEPTSRLCHWQLHTKALIV